MVEIYKNINHLKSIYYIALSIFSLNLFSSSSISFSLEHISSPPLCPLVTVPSFTPVSCVGKADGTATVTVSAGSGDYSYLWTSGGQTGSTATGLVAGLYTVTVTDNTGGCTKTSVVSITQPTLVSISVIKTDASCVGSNDGSAIANPSGGNGTYTYSWTNGATTQTVTGLDPNSYIIKVTDIKGCTKTALVTIGTKPPMTNTFTTSNVLCNGGTTGSIIASPTGGTSPFTYSWNPAGSTGATNTSLAQGTYTVTITDNKGCSITSSTSISEPTVLNVTKTSTNVTCFGGNNGSVTASPTGGTANYTYAWSGTAQTGATATTLIAAIYTVTLTDANGCTVTTSATLTESPPAITSASHLNTSCFGDNDGKAWVTANGLKPPYVYKWNPSLSINDTIFGLTAGSYSVTVTDGMSCSLSTIITITQPAALTGTVNSTNSSCNGATDGTATIVPAGGTPGYSYLWNTIPPQSTATASNLGPGTFTIRLSDAKGCEFYANVTISEAAPIFIGNPSITKETCLLGNAAATISILGGTAPYTYSWDPSAQTTSTITNVAAGTYSVTVTDSKGCTSTKTAVITNQFTPPTANASTINNISCLGANNGRTTVIASAGTPGYSYNWLPSGGGAATASNLSAGTYTVQVTDANGCTATSSASITEPTGMSINASSTNATCGLNNGTANVSASGGTVPYTIAWSNGATSATVNSLVASTYTVTVSDAGNCSQTKSVTISINNPLTINSSATNVTCNGLGNGIATVSPSGGTGTFNYTWAPAGGNTSSINNLTPGTYTVTVNDAGNAACSGTKTITLTQPSVLTAAVSVSNVSCFGNNDGQVSVLSGGGAGSYTYLWSTGGTTSSISALSTGGYTVTVADGNGCTKTGSGTINQNPVLTASVAGDNILCYGQNTGRAIVTTNGGNGQYTYNWLPAGGTGITANNLPVNTYTVTVTDGNACTATSTTTITQPTNFTITTSKVNATCGSNNGSANVAPVGGLTPYTYAWTGGITTATASNLAPGTYTVIVNDANSCAKTATVTIAVSNALSVSNTKSNVSCNGGADGTITLTPSGGSGSYNYNWSSGGYTTNAVSGLTPATYTITITDAGNALCSTTRAITITQPTVLATNITASNISCNGNNDGQATAIPTGGTTPYTYNWNTLAITSNISSLSAASYTVTVTDAKGCTVTKSVTISQSNALAVSINTQSDITCFGLSNGTASINASGGTGSLTYLWQPSGGASATASGLSPNTYTVSINDANNCSSTLTITITEPANLVLTPATTTATCGVADGTASISPTGGVTPYTYNWSNGGANALEINLAPANYTVTVSDGNACTKTQVVTINVGNPITIITGKADLTCNNKGDGLAGVTPSGGSGSYSYLWAPGGATSATINGLAAGTYSVTVIDAVNGACTSSATVIVNEPNPLVVTVTPNNIVCFGQTNGIVNSSPTGGTPTYNYTWSSTGGTGVNISNLGVGGYTVTVSDANSCTATSATTVTEPPPLTLVLDSVNVSCIGAYDGSIGSTTGGGVPGYTYNWAPVGGSTDSITGLGPGIYTLTVTDANGCTIVRSITITEPPAFQINTGGINPSCYINNGEAWVTVTGGSGSFSFLWNPTGSTNDSISGLSPGSYQVRVVDLSTGCDTIGTVSLAWPVVALDLDSLNVTCKNFNDAKAWVVASGATVPYTYLWSYTASTNDTIIGLSPGSYTVTVNDNGGCVSTGSISVSEPEILTLNKSGSDVSCFGGADGTAGITASGGIKSYTYSWSSGQTTSSINGRTAGTYIITLRDSNNCIVIDSIKITQPPIITVNVDSLNISCFGLTNGEVFVTASGGIGILTYVWSVGGATSTTVANLSAGIYTVTVSDANGCTMTDATTVIEPAALALTMNKEEPNCGQTNGKASVTVVGGTGQYTYQWAPTTSTNDTINAVALGSYTVTVTDINGCLEKDSIQLIEPDAIGISPTFTNVLCKSTNNGTAAANASGGSGTYNYTWNPGGYTTATITNLTPGTYTLTVKDNTNAACILVDSVTITEPAILSGSFDSTNVTCFGAMNGTASAVVTGGTSPYTYLWSNGSTSVSLSNLSPATYTITITDANNCNAVDSVLITEPALLMALTDSVNLTCNSYNNGKVMASATGGTAPYIFIWSPGLILNDTVSNLAPGTYTVTVSDVNNCSASKEVSITQPTSTTITMTRTNTACGLSIGTASANATGGSSPFAYLWSNGSTNKNITGLAKGVYVVTVTDSEGCTKKDSVNITEPNGVVVSFTKNNVSCNGGSDGSATISATGGSGSYIYSWIPGGLTTTRTALPAGSYAVKVTDVGNPSCFSIDFVVITQPPVLTASIAKTDVVCFGDSTGMAIVSSTGGTTPYTYSWSLNAFNNDTLSTLKQGTYTVKITDSKACTTSSAVTITQPTPLTTAVTKKSASCGNTDGEAHVKASGGSGTYTYSWTPTYTDNDTLKNLLPGKHFVYVNDTNNCVKIDSITIDLSNGINASLTAVSATCFGDIDGQATVTANGGSGVFTYQWMPINSSNQTIVNLTPGMYTVTVSDININGCQKIDSILVPEPQPVDVVVSVTKSACSGNNDYIATANPVGGTPGYSYTWSFGGTNKIETNLIPGTYIVAVTDSRGCDTAKIFTINSSSSPFILPPAKVNPKCNLSNGSIAVSIFGGMQPYTYAWSPSVSVSDTAKNLAPGTYTLTVTDAFNCSDSRTIVILNTILPPNVVTNGSPAVCFGSSTGSATAIANGGNPPYTYSWSPTGGNTAIANSLPADTYTIAVTDAQECIVTATMLVSEPSDITIDFNTINASCFSANDGSATAIVSGGTPGYFYTWSSGGTSPTESNLGKSDYFITITDANSCTKKDTVAITEPPVLASTISVTNNVFCYGGSNGKIKVSANGGTPAYTYSWSPAGGNDSISTFVPMGTYTVTITDANGCTTTNTSVITQPTQYSAVTIKKNVSCFGGNDGRAKVIVSGSTGPYIYSWAPVQNFTDSISDLKTGTYTLYILDSLSCPFTYVDSITEPTKINVSVTKTDVICTGNDNGTATVVASGGTPQYTYLWPSSGSTSSTVNNLSPAAYVVYATDANGCIDSSSINITEPTPLSLTTNKSDLACFNDSNGTAGVFASGGTPGYTYLWIPGNQTTSGFVGLKAGTYTVSVNDMNACLTVDSVEITQPQPIVVTPTIIDVLCYGQQSGSASLLVSGGTPVYTYSWSTGNLTDMINAVSFGYYPYTVTDSKGCSVLDSVQINQPLPITLTTSETPVNCFDACNGQASVTPLNGVGTYTYSWSTGGTNSTIASVCANSYTVNVRDVNGCSAATSVTITQPTPLLLSPSTVTSHCNQNDGFASVIASGATPPYTYLWNPTARTTNTIDSLLEGSYSVTVVDVNGCIDSANVTIGNAAGPNAFISAFTNTNCFNVCTGTASSQATGGTGPYTYSWNTIPPQLTQNAQNICEGTYVVSITDVYGCTDTANVTIKSPSINLSITASDTNICIGQSVLLNTSVTGGTSPFTHSWNNGLYIGQTYSVSPSTTTTYTLVVTDANGCPSNSQTVTVKVKLPIQVTVTSYPPIACPGVTRTVTVTASGGSGIFNYTWQPGNYTGSTLTVSPNISTSYTITGRDNCGTPADTAIIFVAVHPPPVVKFIATDTIGCLNVCTRFVDQSTVAVGSSIVSWEWDFGDGKTSTKVDPTNCYAGIGKYNVLLKITTDKGCSSTLVKPNYIQILGLPKAQFDIDPDSVGINEPLVNFIDQSTDALQWRWDFGDGSTVDSINFIQNPRHTYKDTGTFCIWQVVTNYDGCTDSIKHCLRVYPEFTFYIPNAFSPNGDGINDGFNGKGTYILEYHMMVFDRWGNLIFVTDSLDLDWDGRANHGTDIAQQDVYVWKVNLVDIFKREHKYVGHVTLVK